MKNIFNKKIFIEIKHSFRNINFVLFLSIATVFTVKSYAQTMKVTVVSDNMTIEKVIDEIEKQTDYLFVYNVNEINRNQRVQVNARDIPVSEVLNKVLNGTDISYAMEGKNIMLMSKSKAPAAVKQNNSRVTGVVIDETGEPVIGANIKVKGQLTGTVTDADGRFVLDVPANSVLEISYIGYVTQEVNVGTRNDLKITLVEDNLLLDEVVVIGYGTARKGDVTGAIASIQSTMLKEVPTVSASSALQGRVAGVDIQQVGFRPGADTQIRIRGTRSLSASNDPLIVLDGIPFSGNFNEIAPGDIKSIDILKDASATAIYGSRGANGVILITTNRGEATAKTQITYNGYYGTNTIAKKYDMMNAEEFVTMRLRSGYQSATPWLPQEQAYFDTGKSYDWQDEMYQTGAVTSHDLSFRAGNQTMQGNIGFNYFNESAVLPGQDFTRFSVRGNMDMKMNSWFKLGLSIQETYNLTNGEGVSSAVMGDILQYSPLVNPYDENGKVVVRPMAPREDSYGPLLVKDKSLWAQERKRFSTMNSIYGEIQFMPELRYRLNVGVNYSHEQYGTFYSQNSHMRNGALSTASINESNRLNYTVDNLLYYDKEFNRKHRLGATLMFSVEDNYSESVTGNGQDMTADYQQYHNLAMANQSVTMNGSYTRRTLISYMGRVNYSYDGKYMLTITGRADGASVLASGKKWHLYPAVSGAWNMNRESFLEDVKILDMLKIRAGYGQTSNQSVSPYSTIGALSQNRYNFGDDLVYGYYTSSIENPTLGWEYTHSYNAGVDFSFWGRLSGTIDVYLQKTNDLLVSQRLPASTGVGGSFLANVGKTENKGIEITLRSENIIPKSRNGFRWDTDFNMYLNRNKILELQSGVEQDIGNGWFVGYPIDVVYDYKKIGIWQLNEAAEAAKYNLVPGDIKLRDYNEDGQISQTGDRYITHTFEPDFTFGLTNRFQYNSFDLTVIAFGQVGGTLVSSMHQNAMLNVLHGRYNQLDVDYWWEDNPTNDHPRPFNSGGQRPYMSTLGYFDATFLRIRTMTLGYAVPNTWLKSVGISELRVYATCNNVATLFSPYMKKGGLDPQPTGFGAQSFRGNSLSTPQQGRQLTISVSTPPTRQILFGVNIRL